MFEPIGDISSIKIDAIPENIRFNILRENDTMEGIESSEVASMQHGQAVFIHLLAEEFHALRHQREAIMGNLPPVCIKELPSVLRAPWAHLSLHHKVSEAIGDTMWLCSEGRIATSQPHISYLVCYDLDIWGGYHDLLQLSCISAFSRHGLTRSHQISNNVTLHLNKAELTSQRVLRFTGAKAVTSLAALPAWEDVMGRVGSVELKRMCDRDYVLLTPAMVEAGAVKISTMLVSAPDDHALEELKQCVPQAMMDAASLVLRRWKEADSLPVGIVFDAECLVTSFDVWLP
eukprot:Skav216343  [mRNA]  locus=scaffold3350:490128:494700:- [translate_table: standard]